uniref:Putative endonuclease V n=1 Tax=Trypanosoma congolense (strain IL3000) TaxID=1068625 RepID=G0UWQ7_TRYCI|nr:putative endonuclease V [Trypanosoma congolense IL3000]
MNPATEDERFAGDAMDCVKKRERWSAIQKQIASRVCVPRTDGIVEYYTDFNGNSVDMRDSFLLPNNIVEEFSATAVGPQLFRDAERRARTALPPLRYVGGVDISFVRGADAAVACLAVMTYPSLEVCRTFVQRCEVSEPYIASYLAFREVGPLLELVEGVREELCAASCFPQLLLVDGCGVPHPAAVWVGKPPGSSVGCSYGWMCQEFHGDRWHYAGDDELTARIGMCCHLWNR